MDTVALWMNENAQEERIQRRALRQSNDIFSLNEESFVKNFRLSKDAFKYVLHEISVQITPQRSHAVNVETKLATALKILGQGGYQHQIGEDRNTGLAQSTVSVCLSEVCSAIDNVLCPKVINFAMTEAEKNRAKHYFFEKTGMPGIIGAVDGTHVQMVRPKSNEHLFFNRKLKHSLNVMMVTDDRMRIRAVNARYGGSSHDSHVWNLSAEREYLRNKFDNGERNSWLIGDSGYPLEPWLLTPFRNARDNSAEARFNTKHSYGRSLVERTIGVAKARFRCLLAARELHYSPLKVAKIVNSCCALHNVCIDFKVPEPTPIFEDEPSTEFVQTFLNNATGSYQHTAINLREEIKRNMR